MACRKARFGLFRADSGYDGVAPTFPRLDGQRFLLPRGPRPRESGSPPTIAGSAGATTSPSIDRDRGVPGRGFIQRKVILVQEIVVPTENPIRVNVFEISDSQKMKRRPRETGDQNVTLLHRGGILSNHGQNSNSPETRTALSLFSFKTDYLSLGEAKLSPRLSLAAATT